MNKDEKLLLEAFTLLYTMYKDQHGGRRYYRPVSIPYAIENKKPIGETYQAGIVVDSKD